MSSYRSPGLDVARSFAIMGVLLAHGVLFFEPLGYDLARTLPWHIWGGFLGVELFFTLSGMLIGQILFCTVLPSPSYKNVSIFLVRRWLRTLPAYYAVLGTLIFVMYLHTGIPEQVWKYLLFFQNSSPEFAQMFPVSWSLSIEQWAYIWIPSLLLVSPLMFAGIRRKHGAEAPWLAILVLCIVLTVLARTWVYLQAPTSWDNDFRKQIPLRLDAIMFGVVIAWIKLFAPTLFSRLSHPACFIGYITLLYWISSCYTMQMFTPIGTFFVKVPAFSLVDLLCALTLCFLDSNLWVRRLFAPETIAGRLTLLGSRYAYSLYLVHYSIFTAGHAGFMAASDKTVFTACLWLLAVMTVSTVVAMALYHCIEKPCMDMRLYFTLTPPSKIALFTGTTRAKH